MKLSWIIHKLFGIKRTGGHKPATGHFIMGLFIWATILLIVHSQAGLTQDASPSIPQADTTQYESLQNSIEVSLQSEEEELKKLKSRVNVIGQEKAALASEVSAYKIQHTAHVNILILPGMEIKDYEKAISNIQTTLITLNDQLKAIREKRHSLQQVRTRLQNQSDVNEKELADIKSQGKKNPAIQPLIQQMKKLLTLLEKKSAHVETLIQFHTLQIDDLEGIHTLFEGMKGKFEAKIKEKKRQALFVRTENAFSLIKTAQIRGEISKIITKVTTLVSPDFWRNEISTIWRSGEYFFVSFILLFAFTQVLFFRLGKYCLVAVNHPICNQCAMLKISLMLIHRSLLMVGAALFLFVYTLIGPVTQIIQVLLYVVLLILYTRWVLDAIRCWEQVKAHQIPVRLKYLLRTLIHLIRYSAIIYTIVAWILDPNSGVLLFFRILFDMVLLLWCILFGNLLRNMAATRKTAHRPYRFIPAITGLTYSIAIIGFLLELAGYGALSVFWFLSWGQTAIVALWAGLSYFTIVEWSQTHPATPVTAMEETEKISITFNWLFVKIAQFAWILTLFISLMIAWGNRQSMLTNIYKILNYSVSVGNLNFSLLKIIHFGLALLITHAVARLWQHFFQRKFLKQSGMGLGLQDSITTITMYSIWGIGILIALHIIGFNSTSLTVGFGALGIGLGFGLQNIFNNFISGLILLFERPIQLGDDIEINGVWATVRKINVRSTVVQTYDNASLIIPNSDLISNQVVNWSFKDKRLRRTIVIGVSYGSDISMVRQTLLEVADKTQRILKYPKPDVVFTDFGDNALIFKVRFWTHVDCFLAVETEARFEIDRLFRERNITIAFPQCDVHLFNESPPSPVHTPDQPEEEDGDKKDKAIGDDSIG